MARLPLSILNSIVATPILWGLALLALGYEWTFGPPAVRGVPLIVLPLAAILGVGKVALPRFGKIAPSFPLLLATLLVCGIRAAVLAALGAGILSALLSPAGPGRWRRALFGASRGALAVWVAGRCFLLTGGRPGPPLSAAETYGLLAAMAGYLLVFSLLTTLRRRPTRREGILPAWRRLILVSGPGCLLGVAVAAGLAVAFDVLGPRGGSGAAGGILAIFYAWKVHHDYIAGSRRREQEITDLYHSIIEAMASAIEAKEGTPELHLRRVQLFAVAIAEMMGLPRRRVDNIRTASLLHDIGKLAVPAYILSKPGRLTEEEFDRVSIHAEVGAEILESTALPYTLAEIVRSHHEKFDGSGYPDGLKGAEIPVCARILAVVDSYDALTSDRPYRRAVSQSEAIRYLQERAGTDYDPQVVGLLAREADRLEEEWRLLRGRRRSGRPAHHWTDAEPPPPTARGAEAGRRSMVRNISSSSQEIFTLYEILEVLGRSLDLQEILTPFAELAGRLVPFRACVLHLVDRSRQFLVPRFAAGADLGEIRSCRIPMGERVSGAAAFHKLAGIHGGAGRRAGDRVPASDWQELPEDHPLRRMASSLVAPLALDEGEVLGVLAFYHPEAGAYREDHLRLLKLLARHVAAAVRNALQYAESQENALTDPLTTLPNARFLTVSFEEELTSASNLRIPLTIVEMDVDNFKDFNDVHGHLTGDKILRGLAKAIQTQLRGCDKCIRYAGDEFIVILPGVGREDVDYVERRLASCIESFTLSPRPGKELRVRISLGSATYPDEGSNFETLIGVADARMYARKYRKKRESDLSHSHSGQDDPARRAS